jgi:hypothetical protein
VSAGALSAVVVWLLSSRREKLVTVFATKLTYRRGSAPSAIALISADLVAAGAMVCATGG